MVTAVLVFAFIAVIVVMATLGAVLVARFALGGGNAAPRIFAAAVGGPFAVVFPGLVIVLSDASVPSDVQAFAGFGFGLAVLSGMIGWPVAHFATRWLDRLTQFDPHVFD